MFIYLFIYYYIGTIKTSGACVLSDQTILRVCEFLCYYDTIEILCQLLTFKYATRKYYVTLVPRGSLSPRHSASSGCDRKIRSSDMEGSYEYIE